MKTLNKISQTIKYWLLSLIALPLLIGNLSNAQDLASDIFEPAKSHWTIFKMWDNPEDVWKWVFESRNQRWADWRPLLWEGSKSKELSLIVKVTKFLLSLVIALSITMIIYNGMIYIIQTWNGKDGKDLVKNLLYIVIWIVIALFSSVIVTIIQSIPKTISQEVDSSIWTENEVNQIIKSEDI